tara:strand:- start:2533 stop:2922 length:390 start_codon:yes stop_codon:yes gene_type:complete
VSEVVLDASALIAMLRAEKGADAVAAVIAGATISAINYAEVVTHFIHAGMPEDEVDAMLDPLPMTVVPIDRTLARAAGRLRALTADLGLSLGDRCCLALARREALPAWTGDRKWKKMSATAGVEVVVFR